MLYSDVSQPVDLVPLFLNLQPLHFTNLKVLVVENCAKIASQTLKNENLMLKSHIIFNNFVMNPMLRTTELYAITSNKLQIQIYSITDSTNIGPTKRSMDPTLRSNAL